MPGVAEVSSAGGFQKQYQVEVDPVKLAAYGIGLHEVLERVRDSNGDVGGRVVEWTGREYMVRGRGYIRSLEDLRRDPGQNPRADGNAGLSVRRRDDPLRPGDAPGSHRTGTARARPSAASWSCAPGRTSRASSRRSRRRSRRVRPSFPPGVELEVAYDRSDLIERAVVHAEASTLIEEMIVVAFVILIFLFHFRSALVPITVLPVAIVISFLPMALLDVSSNIMSLGGLALAIGVLVDASIVMVENAHRHLAAVGSIPAGRAASPRSSRPPSRSAAPIFFSLVIIVVSFLPVFLLTGEEGRLFHPLAFTKTFAIAAASILSITLVPILMVAWMRGRIRSEDNNPAALWTRRLYAPVLNVALRYPRTALLLNFLLIPAVVPLALSLGSEFMPPAPGGLAHVHADRASDDVGRAGEGHPGPDATGSS